MKKILLAPVFLFALAIMIYLPGEAEAVPAFARQTGMACNTCHFQHFPELNAFGRSFKAGGFTMIGGESMVEGDFLSIPAVLNASVMAKTIYQQTYGNNKVGEASQYDNGTWSFPTDANMFLAGRAGEHAGFITEISLLKGAGTNDPATNSVTTEPRMASLKIPFVFEAAKTQFNVIPFTTDGAGPSWSFELLNTGVVETHTPLLHKVETSAPNYLGVGTAATGFAFVAYRPIGYVNYAAWSNDHSGFSGNQQHVGAPLHYLRAVVTPSVGNWDIGLGGATWQGMEKRGALDAPVRTHANAWAADVQALGAVMEHHLGLYASYARAKKSKSLDPLQKDINIFNTSINKDKSAWSVLGELGVIPNRLTAAAGYRSGKNGDPNGDGQVTDGATTLALTYSLAQNIQISLDHSWYSGSGKGSESAEGYTTDGQPAGITVAGPSALTTLTVWAVF